MSWIGWIVGAYLLGAVPFSLLVVHRLRGIDLRTVGSGNLGATNVLRAAGPLPAVTVLLLDVAKGALPVWGAVQLGAPPAVSGAAGVAAAVGHVFPVYLGLHGGKGVATAMGVLGVLAPRSVAVGLALFVVVVASTRFVSLGSLVLVGSVPLSMAALGRLGWATPPEVAAMAAAVAIAALVVYRHAGNIRRLVGGRERRLGESAGAAP